MTNRFALLAKATEQIHPNPEIAFPRLVAEYEAAGAFAPYLLAEKYGCLVNNSGADFAVEFMTMANSFNPGSY